MVQLRRISTRADDAGADRDRQFPKDKKCLSLTPLTPVAYPKKVSVPSGFQSAATTMELRTRLSVLNADSFALSSTSTTNPSSCLVAPHLAELINTDSKISSELVGDLFSRRTPLKLPCRNGRIGTGG